MPSPCHKRKLVPKIPHIILSEESPLPSVARDVGECL
jgi:hypothetical protein